MGTRDNILRIKEEIGKVNLVAVTKTRSIAEIIEALDSGIKIIGENRVQEAVQKYPGLKQDLKKRGAELHFIGHLQSNKIDVAIELFDVIESVDSMKLAFLLDLAAKKKGKMQRAFLQINIGREKQKFGVLPEDADMIAKDIKKLKNIELNGLMCIPPYSSDPEASRRYFREMKIIYDRINVKYLSMGMTDDYRVAIEEGANMIRVGRGIFGVRKY